MASALNVYTSEPADLVLAHTLLKSKLKTEPSHFSTASDSEWNLQEDWDAGIRVSNTGIFRSGTVIGFSRLRTRNRDSDEYIGQIPRHLLTTHLLRLPPSSDTAAFIIHPSNFEAFAPRTLLHALQSTVESHVSMDNAIKRLDSVQLLPVHSFPNAGQAIGQVSESLQSIAENRRVLSQTNNANQPDHPILLIVVGLDTLAEGILRASNPIKGTALLAATLRNLTRMSRAYASFLSIILVNTNGLGSPIYGSGKQSPADSKEPQVPEAEDSRSLRDDGIHSIFQSSEPSLLSNLLMKTLDQGIDTHILLSDVKATPVAEVIKDRVGSGVGKWGIWSPKQ